MPGQLIWACLNPDSITRRDWIPVKASPDGRLQVDIGEQTLESGVATFGTNATLQDNTKDWEIDMHEDSILKVVIDDIEYHRTITGNIERVLTFNALPVGIEVATGCVYSITKMANPLSPLARAEMQNVAVVGGVDILGAALAPLNTPCLFRVQVGFLGAGVFSATITRAGNTQIQHFNHGVVLTADCLFMFDLLVHSGDTINYRYSVNTTLQTLRLQEIVAATQ